MPIGLWSRRRGKDAGVARSTILPQTPWSFRQGSGSGCCYSSACSSGLRCSPFSLDSNGGQCFYCSGATAKDYCTTPRCRSPRAATTSGSATSTKQGRSSISRSQVGTGDSWPQHDVHVSYDGIGTEQHAWCNTCSCHGERHDVWCRCRPIDATGRLIPPRQPTATAAAITASTTDASASGGQGSWDCAAVAAANVTAVAAANATGAAAVEPSGKQGNAQHSWATVHLSARDVARNPPGSCCARPRDGQEGSCCCREGIGAHRASCACHVTTVARRNACNCCTSSSTSCCWVSNRDIASSKFGKHGCFDFGSCRTGINSAAASAFATSHWQQSESELWQCDLSKTSARCGSSKGAPAQQQC